MTISAQDIKKAAYDLGADLCGIASIDRFGEAPKGFHPSDVLPDCQSVIVLAKRFLKSALYAKSTIPYTTVRNELSTQMNVLAVNLSQYLEVCPVKALDGVSIEQSLCIKHAFGQHNGGEWRIKCFACRKVCPNGLGIKKAE